MTDILDVPKLAALLGCTMPCARQMARQKRIPAQKAGKKWIFSYAAIMEWLNQPYSEKCPTSTVKKVRQTGISQSLSAAKDLDRLLGRATGKRRKSTQTRSRPEAGARRS